MFVLSINSQADAHPQVEPAGITTRRGRPPATSGKEASKVPWYRPMSTECLRRSPRALQRVHSVGRITTDILDRRRAALMR
jgi:hypothetical protein